MSRRRSSFEDGLGRGRQAAAEQLLDQLVQRAPAARDWTQSPDLPGRRARTIEELIEASGGVTGLARDAGVARRTVQSWRNQGVTPRASSREKLDRVNDHIDATDRRAVAQREFGELAKRYGGTKGLAAAVGVSAGTASRWLTGQSAPSVGNLAALKRADYQWRIAKTHGLTLGSDGAPAKRMHFRTTGEARVIGSSGSPEDDRGSRTWGEASQGMGMPGIEFNDTGGYLGGFWGAASDGDALGALDAFQAYMSTEVTNCSGYDPANGIGVFFENFENFELLEDPLDDLYDGLS